MDVCADRADEHAGRADKSADKRKSMQMRMQTERESADSRRVQEKAGEGTDRANKHRSVQKEHEKKMNA